MLLARGFASKWRAKLSSGSLAAAIAVRWSSRSPLVALLRLGFRSSNSSSIDQPPQPPKSPSATVSLRGAPRLPDLRTRIRTAQARQRQLAPAAAHRDV